MKARTTVNMPFYRLLIVSAVSVIFITACGTPSMNTKAMPGYFLSGETKHADFKLERVRMEFASGLPDRTVKQGQEVKPQAFIDFRGTGVLRAKWLLDDMILEQLNIPLNHGSMVSLSPHKAITTAHLAPGQHRIRLLISQPGSGFKQPELTFFITP